MLSPSGISVVPTVAAQAAILDPRGRVVLVGQRRTLRALEGVDVDARSGRVTAAADHAQEEQPSHLAIILYFCGGGGFLARGLTLRCVPMYLGIVKGTVVAERKYAGLEGTKLLMVQPVDEHGTPVGDLQAAVARVQAGLGDLV